MNPTTGFSAGHGRPRRPRGFTLIELLVVIAIISLLLAILSPTLKNARTVVQRTQCLARQRGIGQALTQYATQNRGSYPHSRIPGMFADAYDLRRTYPYSGATDRPPLGQGLLVSTGILPSGSLGDIIHCPSLNNLSGTLPGHCMDVAHSCGYGGSWWNEYPDHRIIGGFNYRGASYERAHVRPPRMDNVGPDFVLLMDTPDLRIRGEKSLYNAHGGYNHVFADGSGSFFPDREYTVDQIALDLSGGTVDGRRGASEPIFEYIARQR